MPGVCDFVIDQRHLDLAALDRMLVEAQAAASTIAAEERVEVGWSLVYKTDPVRFDPELIEICEAAVVEVSRSSHRMPSGPLHDATSMAQAGISWELGVHVSGGRPVIWSWSWSCPFVRWIAQCIGRWAARPTKEPGPRLCCAQDQLPRRQVVRVHRGPPWTDSFHEMRSSRTAPQRRGS